MDRRNPSPRRMTDGQFDVLSRLKEQGGVVDSKTVKGADVIGLMAEGLVTTVRGSVVLTPQGREWIAAAVAAKLDFSPLSDEIQPPDE